jgi:hypothetical protein
LANVAAELAETEVAPAVEFALDKVEGKLPLPVSAAGSENAVSICAMRANIGPRDIVPMIGR